MRGSKTRYATSTLCAAVWASVVIGGVTAWPVSVSAADGEEQTDTVELGQISVTAARGPEGVELASVPGSVTVITREEIERQSVVSPTVADLLARNVPGFSPSNNARTNFGETLRGRDFLVMINGVPISTPLRDGARDLQTIDLSAVERIEVVRGSVALYGHGATGGIVNIITRKAGAGERRWTEIGTSFSWTHPDDSAGVHFGQGWSGGTADTRYTFSFSVEHNESFFDAEGDRIPPNPFGSQGGSEADSTSYNLNARVNHALDDARSIGLSVNFYDSTQDSEYTANFDTGNPNTSEKAEAVQRGPRRPNEIEVGTENLILALTYRDRDLWGQEFSTKFYYQEIEAVFAWFDWSTFPTVNEGGNSIIKSEKIGLRGEFDSEIGSTSLTWGADFAREETSQPITNGRVLTPKMVQYTFAPFVQARHDIGDHWVLRGGVRYQMARVEVDDFTTVQTAPNSVEGGTLEYSETLFNLGAVYHINRTYSVFASFSQGFSLAEIGNILRSTQRGSVEEIDPEAQVVDNYEIGLRAVGLTWDASITVFQSRSELGTSYRKTSNGGFVPVRREEKIYGLEADVNVNVGRNWRVGGTLTLIEGRYDSDDDSDLDEYINGIRIDPPKLTTYVEYHGAQWTHRVSLLYVGSRDRFDDDSTVFGRGEVDSYATVNLVSATQLGDGTLRIGISNLFNEQYIPALGQAYNFSGVGYTAAPGRRVSASYEWQW